MFWPGEFHGLYSPWGCRVRHNWATCTYTCKPHWFSNLIRDQILVSNPRPGVSSNQFKPLPPQGGSVNHTHTYTPLTLPLCSLLEAQVLYWLFVIPAYLTSIQFVFRENCFTCRCTFDVFLGGGEFNIFLWWHLHLLSIKCHFWCQNHNTNNSWIFTYF